MDLDNIVVIKYLPAVLRIQIQDSMPFRLLDPWIRDPGSGMGN